MPKTTLNNRLNHALPTKDPTKVGRLTPGMPSTVLQADYGLGQGFGAWSTNGYSSFMLRDAHIGEFGFALLSAETLAALVALIREGTVLEVGAGTGYLSDWLGKAGVRVTASDIGGSHFSGYGFRTVHRRDHEGDSVALLPGDFSHVLLSWPAGDLAYRTAEAMRPEQILVYQGEGPGGCTADDAFFETTHDEGAWEALRHESQALNQAHVQFPGIHDRWHVLRKR